MSDDLRQGLFSEYNEQLKKAEATIRQQRALLDQCERALSISSLAPAHCNCGDCELVRATLAAIRSEGDD